MSVSCGKFRVDRGVGVGSITAELPSVDGGSGNQKIDRRLRSRFSRERKCWGRCLPWTGLTQPRQTDPWLGWHCAEQESANACQPEVSAACASPSDRDMRRGSTGELCALERRMKHFCVELKVCEGCGGLWLRARNHGVYCRKCALLLSEFPAPRQRSRAGRKRKLQLAVCEGGTK